MDLGKKRDITQELLKYTATHRLHYFKYRKLVQYFDSELKKKQ